MENDNEKPIRVEREDSEGKLITKVLLNNRSRKHHYKFSKRR